MRHALLALWTLITVLLLAALLSACSVSAGVVHRVVLSSTECVPLYFAPDANAPHPSCVPPGDAVDVVVREPFAGEFYGVLWQGHAGWVWLPTPPSWNGMASP